MTFRVDVVAGLVSILESFKAANPTLLLRVFTTTPPNFNTDLPCAFVGPRNERATHDQQIRTRQMVPTIVFVDHITDNEETMGRMDRLVDAFADYLTDRPHVVAGTVWDRWQIIDDQIKVGDGSLLQSATFTLNDLSISEGRV